nr:syntaxin-71-like [Tanacetum cinerariifolium]
MDDKLEMNRHMGLYKGQDIRVFGIWQPYIIGVLEFAATSSFASPLNQVLEMLVKGLAPEEFAARNDLVQALHRIQALHDGGAIALKQGD